MNITKANEKCPCLKWQKIGFVFIMRQMRFTILYSYKCLHHFSLSLFIRSLFLCLVPSYFLPCSLFFLQWTRLMGTAPVTIVTRRYEHVSVCVLCSKDSSYDTDTLSHTHLRLMWDWIVKYKSKWDKVAALKCFWTSILSGLQIHIFWVFDMHDERLQICSQILQLVYIH